MSTFVIHQNSLGVNEKDYLSGSNATIISGFTPNSPAYAAAVNAILHETSLVVTAIASKINTVFSSNQITPESTSANVITAFENYIKQLKPTNAVTADKVAHSFVFNANGGTPITFNGLTDVTTSTFYMPTTSGAVNQLLISSGANHVPTWLTSNLGSATKSIYVTNGVLAEGKTYAGGTVVTLNNVSKAENSASFYAPTTAGTQNQVLVSGGTNNAPTWLTSNLGSATKSIYIEGGILKEGDTYAGGTAVTLNGSDKSASTASFYAPISSTNQTDQYDSTVWFDNDDNRPVFATAPITRKKVDDGWAATDRICHAINSNDNYITSNSNNNRFVHSMHGITYDTDNDIIKSYEYISANANYTGPVKATDKTAAFVWSFWGYSTGAGDKMKLTRSTTGAITLEVKGSIESTAAMSATSVTATTFTATSDIRKKDHVTDYSPKQSILDLPVKEFDMKSDGSHHIGCIAQDLQKIAPELVHEDKDGYLSIEETKLVYLLLDEVKKLRKELDELKGNK